MHRIDGPGAGEVARDGGLDFAGHITLLSKELPQPNRRRKTNDVNKVVERLIIRWKETL